MDQDVMRGALARELNKRITEVVEGNGRPFKWGICDCALWPADIHKSAGLSDPMKPWRGKYRSMLGAHRIIGKRGGMMESMRKLAKVMGWKEIAATDAKTGDLGLIKRMVPMKKKLGPDGPDMIGFAEVTFCVIRGPQGDWHGPIDNGISFNPDRDVLAAWDVLPE